MAFKGTVTSDFMKLVSVNDADKENQINFASTDFVTLRNSLINYIRAVYPLDYNYFVESDFGMVLIELVAYMGHVLSYKADYLANENFIRTARDRNSVKDLLQLIGVRMKGPIAAAADAKLTLASIPGLSNPGEYIQITPQNRVVTITSPEDGLPITFTLYKVAAAGDIDVANSTGDINLFDAERSSTTVFNNLVLLEGSLVVDTGTFADTEALKSVKLQQSPVIEGSVQVFVTSPGNTNGIYKQVNNIFYASGTDAKVFQLISDDDYGATVVFGDNNVGRNPAIGDQYTITYRVGGGTRGNIGQGLLNAQITTANYTNPDGNLAIAGIPGTVQNTSKGTGGSDAETVENAKKYAPLAFRSQSRLVTLDDYKAFVNNYISSYGSIGKATAATRRAYSSANVIDIFVLEKANNLQLRKATPEYKRQLLEAMQDSKMLTDELVVVDGLIRTLDLNITLRLEKKYQYLEANIRQQVRNKIETFFNIDNTDFAKAFNPEDLMYSIFEVPEVRYATIDNVKESIKVDFNEIVQLNNYTLNITYV
jgi:hypothetical protein